MSHAGSDGFQYIVAGYIHAQAGNRIARLGGRRKMAGPIGKALSRSRAYHSYRWRQGLGEKGAFFLAPLEARTSLGE
jgi:hypothetical protein